MWKKSVIAVIALFLQPVMIVSLCAQPTDSTTEPYTLGEEVAFGLENLGTPPREMEEKIHAALPRCLTGFIPPFSGHVPIKGKKPVPSRLRKSTGCLFQNPERQLFETSVIQEVAFPIKRLGTHKREAISQAEAILTKWGIDDLSEASPHKLSYGQKHLVALASILAHHPRLIILDDPFAGLDQKKISHVMDLLTKTNEQQGATIIWTTHSPDTLDGWADVTLNIKGGKIIDPT